MAANPEKSQTIGFSQGAKTYFFKNLLFKQLIVEQLQQGAKPGPVACWSAKLYVNLYLLEEKTWESPWNLDPVCATTWDVGVALN